MRDKNVKNSTLINRSPVGFFSPSRGIRQGDPLSSFLFILAMEGLSLMLVKAKQLQWIDGFTVNVGTIVSVYLLLLMTILFYVQQRNHQSYT